MGLKVRCLEAIDLCFPRYFIAFLFCGSSLASASVSSLIVSWVFVKKSLPPVFCQPPLLPPILIP